MRLEKSCVGIGLPFLLHFSGAFLAAIPSQYIDRI